MPLDIVQTTLGKARGIALEEQYEGITVFRGIPYAAPPVGDLRFAPPRDAEGWTGVRTFDRYAPDAVQFYSDAYNPQTFTEMNEDCLYLNVTTPASSPEEKYPVMLWLHGGGLTNGSPRNELMLSLAKKGIVIVSIAHRVNMFGYIALPQLTEEYGASGNYGLMDQLKALDWITDNIRQFGGDPENITAAGVSGGCQKACMLACNPAANGRIRKVFNASGLKWKQIPFPTVKEAEQTGRDYLAYIGVDPDLPLKKLRALDVNTIHKAVPRHIYPGDMVCDKKLITEPSFSAMFDRYLPDGVSFINGTTLGEANIFATHETTGVYSTYSETASIETVSQFYEHFHRLLGPLYESYDFENLIRIQKDESAFNEARTLGSLGLAVWGGNNHSRNLMLNRIFGSYLKERSPKNRAYSYLWSYILPCPPEDAGTVRDPKRLLAQHGTDIWFYSGSLLDGMHTEKPWRPEDFALCETALSYFANFIRSGDPNGKELPPWPASEDDYGYINFTAEGVTAGQGIQSPLDRLIYDYVRGEYRL